MSSYHHLDSRHARLSPSAIDFVLESVRDANEVLVETHELPARNMLIIARSVLETERLFARDPELLTEPDQPLGDDWTCACMAEGFALAVEQLQGRGALQAAERAQAQCDVVLRRIADSATCSPLIDYARILRALIDGTRAPEAKPREQLDLLRRYLAEDLRSNQGRNALGALLEIAIVHLRLGQHALAFDMFTEVLRQEPTSARTHSALACALEHDFPELASAAAQRALLLASRETGEPQRASLRAVLERTAGARASGTPTPPYAALLALLRDKPGKRQRLAVATLCESLVPEVAYVQPKPPPPLPDAKALAQLRRDLRDLPLPQVPHVQSKLPVTVAARRT